MAKILVRTKKFAIISPFWRKDIAKQKIMKFRKCNLINVVKNVKFHENWLSGCRDISAQNWCFKA
jgi:hypothetical protein